LSLFERAETRTAEVGDVNEHISAVSAGDEAETLLLGEPTHKKTNKQGRNKQ
jgi:hypothetical protein